MKGSRNKVISTDVCIFECSDSKKPDQVFGPCGHCCCCKECAITQNVKQCPVCNTEIKQTQSISYVNFITCYHMSDLNEDLQINPSRVLKNTIPYSYIIEGLKEGRWPIEKYDGVISDLIETEEQNYITVPKEVARDTMLSLMRTTSIIEKLYEDFFETKT